MLRRDKNDGMERKREDDSTMENLKENEKERICNHKMRLTAHSTRKHSVGLRFVCAAMWLIHLNSLLTEGLVIDPKPTILDNTEPENINNYTYCLGSGDPIRFLDPFNPRIANTPTFLMLNWDFNKSTLLLEFIDKVILYGPDRVKTYQSWGIEINDVTKADAGVYRTALLYRVGSEEQYKMGSMEVLILTPPVLESKKLEIRRQVEGDTVTLTCGKVASLGDPPITLQLKTSEGQVLNSSYSQGTLSVTLPKEQDASDFVCEMDKNNSLAASCLSYFERDKWKTVGPPFPSTTPHIPTTSGLPQPEPETTTIATEGTTKKDFEAAPETVAEENISILDYVLLGTLAVLVLLVVANFIHSRWTKEEETPPQPEVAEIQSLDTETKERIDTIGTPV